MGGCLLDEAEADEDNEAKMVPSSIEVSWIGRRKNLE